MGEIMKLLIIGSTEELPLNEIVSSPRGDFRRSGWRLSPKM